MLHRLYNALWYPALPIALALSGAARDPETRRARMGRGWSGNGTAAAEGAARIWAHASSVGEVGALAAAVNAIARERPGTVFIVTAMTAAGRDAARRTMPAAQAHLLAPLDARPALGRFLRVARPTLVLIAETELWPNYFVESHRAGARLAIVNGRISERALGRYRYVQPLLREALAAADVVLAQTDEDARRFVSLGAEPARVFVTGNTKFDAPSLAASPLRAELALFMSERPILAAGSTAPGEEQIVIDAWRELRPRFARLGLVIAPRHLERAGEVAEMLRAAKIEYTAASAIDARAAQSREVLLLDSIGELRAVYARAAAAFVGGSLLPGRGGQSLAEPAAAGVPVLFGPYHENQRAMAAALLECRAAIVVRDAAELARAVCELLADEPARAETGRRARAAVERMGGGVAATMARLRPLLEGE
jgi:3-deoxy-D-manno-octulosonic-acid transferase